MNNTLSYNKEIMPDNIASYGIWRHFIMMPLAFNKNVIINDNRFEVRNNCKINNNTMHNNNSRIDMRVTSNTNNFYAKKRERKLKSNLRRYVKQELFDKKEINSQEINNQEADNQEINRQEADIDIRDQRCKQIIEKQKNRKNKRMSNEFGKGYAFSRYNLM